MLEIASVSFCSAHKFHEGGEYDFMVLAAVQIDFFVHDAAQAELWSFRAALFNI